jgi:hypothetical protein
MTVQQYSWIAVSGLHVRHLMPKTRPLLSAMLRRSGFFSFLVNGGESVPNRAICQ